MKNTKLTKKIVASAVALTTAAGASMYAFAAGGEDGKDANGQGNKTTHGEWFIDDNNHAPTVDSVRWFISQMVNRKGKMTKAVESKAQDALNGAVASCQARGGTNCRLVGVGVAISSADYYDVNNIVGKSGMEAYRNSLASFSNKQLSYNGSNYNIYTAFQRGDGVMTSIAQLGAESMDRTGDNSNINVIVLSQDQPKTDYHLSVSTQQQGGFPLSGLTTPVHDSIMTSNDAGQSESLNASVWLHWDGFGDPPRAQSSQLPATHTAFISRPAFRVVASGLRTRAQ